MLSSVYGAGLNEIRVDGDLWDTYHLYLSFCQFCDMISVDKHILVMNGERVCCITDIRQQEDMCQLFEIAWSENGAPERETKEKGACVFFFACNAYASHPKH